MNRPAVNLRHGTPAARGTSVTRGTSVARCTPVTRRVPVAHGEPVTRRAPVTHGTPVTRREPVAGAGRAGPPQATSAVTRTVDAIVAEPTTRVPSYSTIAWPGATPRTGSVKRTLSSPSTSSAVTSVSPPWARSWAV
ncbi:hypothetical protein RKD26_001899 [Streptomyces calvus]